MNASIFKLFKGKYRYSDDIGEYLKIEGVNKPVLLRKASSGQQESIRIVQDAILQIADESHVFRVLEEPESHLFPSGQHRLLEILATLVNNHLEEEGWRQNQLFITTHSPYILNILNNLIFAGDLEIEGRDSNELADTIPKKFRLKPNYVSAYMLKPEGTCIPINDTAEGDFSKNATGVIGGNALENYWNELQNQFDTLLEISE